MLSLPSNLAFIGNIGTMEWIIILIVMLMLFGRRLPEVGKSLGKGIVEFKRGLKGVEDEIEEQASRPAPSTQLPPPPAPYQHPGHLPPAQGQAPMAPGQPGTVSRAESAHVESQSTPTH